MNKKYTPNGANPSRTTRINAEAKPCTERKRTPNPSEVHGSPRISTDMRDHGAAILRLPAVRSRVGISRTSIYQGMSEGTFPSGIKLGPKSVGWLSHEVEAWLAERIAESRPAAEASTATIGQNQHGR